MQELREYLPRTRDMRNNVHSLAVNDAFGPLQIQPEAQGALPQACELYNRVGCAAPSMEFLLANSDADLESWRDQVNTFVSYQSIDLFCAVLR
jgi:hypothetical protein